MKLKRFAKMLLQTAGGTARTKYTALTGRRSAFFATVFGAQVRATYHIVDFARSGQAAS